MLAWFSDDDHMNRDETCWPVVSGEESLANCCPRVRVGGLGNFNP